MNKVTIENGVFHVEGQIDELFDYKVFDGIARPLKLDLAKVRNVNSIGCREFIKFVKREAPLGLEFHRCSAAMMDMINSIPSSLGSPPRLEIVKSIILTYHCRGCTKDEPHLLHVQPGKSGKVPDFPSLACSACKLAMVPTVEAEDLFTYLLVDD